MTDLGKAKEQADTGNRCAFSAFAVCAWAFLLGVSSLFAWGLLVLSAPVAFTVETQRSVAGAFVDVGSTLFAVLLGFIFKVRLEMDMELMH